MNIGGKNKLHNYNKVDLVSNENTNRFRFFLVQIYKKSFENLDLFLQLICCKVSIKLLALNSRLQMMLLPLSQFFYKNHLRGNIFVYAVKLPIIDGT